jgi:hypothetical protein
VSLAGFPFQIRGKAMKKTDLLLRLSIAAILIASTLLLGSGEGLAHCDGIDGPVVLTARKALDTGNVNLVLTWVRKKDEREIRDTFQKTLAVRKLGPEARDLADMYFFETLVRMHRAGEGAPYTGLKPAGRDLGPAVPAADTALADGNVEPLVKLLTRSVNEGVHDQFARVRSKRNFNKDDVEAGRDYVEAYVSYIHYVERLYEDSRKAEHGHYQEPAEHEEHAPPQVESH